MGGVSSTQLNPGCLTTVERSSIMPRTAFCCLYRAFAALVERLRSRSKSVEHYVCFDDDFESLLNAEDGNYRWHQGDERATLAAFATPAAPREPEGVLERASFDRASRNERHCAGHLRCVGTLGHAAGGTNVSRRKLVHSVWPRRSRIQTGDLRRQSAERLCNLFNAGGKSLMRGRADGLARND